MIVILVIAGAPELVYVTLSTYLQHNTRSEFRATSMSIAEGAFSIQMLWLFPLVGWLNDNEGWTTGYAVCAALSLVATALFIASQRLAGLEAPDPAAA
jgi:MFS family permease